MKFFEVERWEAGVGPAEELQPPREAVLIRLARQARGLSPEAAAELTPIRLRGGRWRQIENGYERKNPPKKVQAPDLTLAHMAHVVGVTPDRLEGVGRGPAAVILREILRAEADAAPADSPHLSPEERLMRRVVAAAARELELSPGQVDDVMRLVRQDLDQEPRATAPPGRTESQQERPVPDQEDDWAPHGYGQDLSDLVRARRLDAGMSLQDVAAAAVDPGSGDHVIEADWLDRLERAELRQDENPEYPQLDALAVVLHLDPAEVQEAAGRQYMGVETLWSDDGEVQGIALGPVSDEARQKLSRLMNTYRPVPRDGRK
ncbi:transcriptional regulator with XRE-family HTH domain [Streptomyces umbrinus]|uniref:helix-turn-helix domain-containing protein n=1 Tax=Streptomyces umbrinus TaxID=67370 RepID=UPI00167E232A|nr:helix-turn-helix domain-containing protein [Streptomyces umbrinus]MCR3732225.1 transcriptional regulator with XRE-family HTH domain [Streptomyces umbrinus]